MDYAVYLYIFLFYVFVDRSHCQGSQCIDSLATCKWISANCNDFNIMLLCPQTCIACSQDCVDRNPQTCAQYKAINQCAAVQHVCRRSCTNCAQTTASWNEWDQWSACSLTCGGGQRTRQRTCQGGATCQGEGTQSETCNSIACARGQTGGGSVGTCVDSQWWCGQLSGSCSDLAVSSQCQKTCNNCPGTGSIGWGAFGDWGICSATCGGGRQRKTRQCQGQASSCPGLNFEDRDCATPQCPTTGGVDCANKENWCPQFKGSCAFDTYVKTQCPKTCETCTTTVSQCVDSETWCSGYDLNSCNLYPSLKTSCKFTCGTCETITHGWSEWSEWKCDVTCGPGTQSRSRTCVRLSRSECPGADFEQSSCNAECAKWNDWDQWTKCSASCAGGKRTRNRTCQSGNCVGKKNQEENCNGSPCPDASGYGPWTNWSNCKVTCGGGVIQRTRNCGTGECTENSKEIKNCAMNACPATDCSNRDTEANCLSYQLLGYCFSPQVRAFCRKTCKECTASASDGWDKWSKYGPCSNNCGYGEKSRTRTCPASNCQGKKKQTITCKGDSCGKSDPVWTPWTEFDACSTTCGPGEKKKTRTCSEPNKCSGISEMKESCNLGQCKVPAEWSNWTTGFDSCSQTCGGGTQKRTRTCSTGNSKDCTGNAEIIRDCGTAKCEGPPEWFVWTKFDDCTVTCGGGTQSRTRKCSQENKCTGDSSQTRNCNRQACPKWNNWENFPPCSRTCGGGKQTRTRTCTVPGKCTGNSSNEQKCNEQVCSGLTGTWSGWGGWGKCSQVCGGGKIKRQRLCSGKNLCSGDNSEEKSCNGFTCITTNWSPCTKTCGTGSRSRTVCTSGTCETMFQSCGNGACPAAPCGDPLGKRYEYHDCCVKEVLPIDQQCGQPQLGARVFGGKAAKHKQWPWMAAFDIGGALCGGSIISKRWIISAAHCFTDENDKAVPFVNFRAYVGIVSLLATSQALEIEEVIIHPDYVFPQGDIALVKLKKDLILTAYVKPICLPRGEITPKDTKCFVTGWGVSNISGVRTNDLQEAGVWNLDEQVCRQGYRKHLPAFSTLVDKEHRLLCVGSIDRKIDSCQGDSGGPIACQRCSSCSFYITGIVSFGPEVCATPGVPGMYTRVLDYEDWIHEKTGLPRYSAKSCSRSVGP